MKRFLKDIINVTCILICLIVTVEIIQYYVSDNNYSYKSKYIKNHKDSIEGLILGHSHTLRGIDPALLGKNVFNNAESGKWIYYDAKELSKYVPDMSNLRFVIYPIGYDMPQGFLSCHYEHDHNFKKEDNHDYNIHMYAKYEHIPYDRFPLKLTAFSSFLTDTFISRYLKYIFLVILTLEISSKFWLSISPKYKVSPVNTSKELFWAPYSSIILQKT